MYFGMGGGAKYAGCFEKNLKHGAGLVICENGVSYEANPLFINDKAVLSTNPESDNVTTATSSNMNKHIKDKHKHTNTPVNHSETPSSNNNNNDDAFPRKISTFRLINKHTQTKIPISTLDADTLLNISLNQQKCPQDKSNIYIPINTADDQINISSYIEKIVEKFNKTLLKPDSKIWSKDLSFDSSQ